MENKDNYIRNMAIKHDLADFKTLSAFERFNEVLKSIADENKIDTGMGMEGFDFWVKIAGFEWFVQVKPSNAMLEARQKAGE